MDKGRRTRIVATLGPVSRSAHVVGRLMDAGVNVFRINFSHATHAIHGETIRTVRAVAAEKRRHVGILQDLQGPKIRVGDLENHQPVELIAGRELRITTEHCIGTAERVSTTYEALPKDVRPGDTILLDDGHMQLEARNVAEREVVCVVRIGGLLREHKGINLPQTPLSAPSLTEKDREDLRFGLEAGVDFIGLSFVRQASDIEQLRQEARRWGKTAFVIAKIERIEAIANLDAIIAAADGIMVARGDLGVETSAAEVPILQKRILSAATQWCKPDITATQMLETMVTNPQPSRAEATDVANAVFDGTDAVMLSAETAMGKYPVESVRTMSQIALLAEKHLAEYHRPVMRRIREGAESVAEATVRAAIAAAREVRAEAIAVFTQSGRTAFQVSALRPDAPILALTPREDTCRRLALAWGVEPRLTESVVRPEDMVAVLDRVLRETQFVAPGRHAVMISGATTDPGSTNMVRIHRVSTP